MLELAAVQLVNVGKMLGHQKDAKQLRCAGHS